jgi:hypothetical protein
MAWEQTHPHQELNHSVKKTYQPKAFLRNRFCLIITFPHHTYVVLSINGTYSTFHIPVANPTKTIANQYQQFLIITASRETAQSWEYH